MENFNTLNQTWAPRMTSRQLVIEEPDRNQQNQTQMTTSNSELARAPRMTSRQLIIEEPDHNQRIIVQQPHRNPNNELPIPDLFNQDIPFVERLRIAEQNENFNRNLNMFFLERFERRLILENIQENYFSSTFQYKHPNNVTDFNNQ